MKSINNMLKILIVGISILLFDQELSAQTASRLKYVKNPCNCDGQVEVDLAGVGLPVTLNIWHNGQSSTQLVPAGKTKDTIFNVCNGYISVWGSGSSGGAGIQEGTSYNLFTVTGNFFAMTKCPNKATLNLNVSGGTAPYTYAWREVGSTAIIGTTMPMQLGAGNYSLEITDNNGCSYKINDSLSVWDSLPMRPTLVTTLASCSNGTATVASVSGGTGPYTYKWQNGATSQTITGLVSGSVIVTVTDALGCKGFDKGFVEQNPNIRINHTISPENCLNANGGITAFPTGGTPPYTYLWSNGSTSQNLTGVSAGNYNLTVTDANGCIGFGGQNINRISPIIVQANATSPSGCNTTDGAITLSISGGTTPYIIKWLNSTSTNTTRTSLGLGYYAFEVVDATGCVQTGAVQLSESNPVKLAQYATHNTCPANNMGVINSYISGGVGPFGFLWSNGATTANISNLTTGYYSLTVTDSRGCKASGSRWIDSKSDFSLAMTHSPTTCKYTADGNANVSIIGPASTYTYAWSQGATTASVSGLASGSYIVTVTNAGGCKAYNYVEVGSSNTSNACYCKVNGYVYYDVNGNGIKDAGEIGVANIGMYLSGYGTHYTDGNGFYSFDLPAGSYTLKQDTSTIKSKMKSGVSNTVNFTVTPSANCVMNYHFADTLIPIQDLNIATIAVPRTSTFPGEVFNQRIIVKNNGNVNAPNVSLSYKHNQILNLTAVSSDLQMVGADRVVNHSSYPALNAGHSQSSDLNYFVPTTTPIGTLINIFDTVSSVTPLTTGWLQDYTPWDNVNYFSVYSHNSYDPNMIEATPRGEGNNYDIPVDQKNIVYTIHFQNLGNAAARNIRIANFPSNKLDLSKLNVIKTSHKAVTRLKEDGSIEFMFAGINLADSASGGEASKGYVVYSVPLLPNQVAGNQLTNVADIYFDYNEPVRTNTYKHNLKASSSSAGVHPQSLVADHSVSIYPNPASDRAKVQVEIAKPVKEATMNIYDLNGKHIYQWNQKNITTGNYSKDYDVSNLPNGIYILNLQLDNETKSLKLEVAR